MVMVTPTLQRSWKHEQVNEGKRLEEILAFVKPKQLYWAHKGSQNNSLFFFFFFFFIWQMAQERSVPRFTSDWEKGRSWVGGPDDVTCLFSADLSSLGSGPFTCISLGCCNGFHQPTTLAHGQKELSWLLWAAISKVLLHQLWREGACRLLGDAILLTRREMQPLNTRS